MLDPSYPWYKYDDNAQYGRRARSSSRASRATPLEAMEQDPTQVSAPESTDTEMYQVVERDLLIMNNYEAGLVRNAAKAHDQAAGSNEQCMKRAIQGARRRGGGMPSYPGTTTVN